MLAVPIAVALPCPPQLGISPSAAGMPSSNTVNPSSDAAISSDVTQNRARFAKVLVLVHRAITIQAKHAATVPIASTRIAP